MNPEPITNTLALLQEAGRQAATPEQHEALENARLVLSFIEGRGEAESFGSCLLYTSDAADE